MQLTPQHVGAATQNFAQERIEDIFRLCPEHILVTTATTGSGVLFFQAGVLFSPENAEGTAFSKVYSENINTIILTFFSCPADSSIGDLVTHSLRH